MIDFRDYEFYTCADTGDLLVSWDKEMFFEMRTGHMAYRRRCLRYTGFTTDAMEGRAALLFREKGLR